MLSYMNANLTFFHQGYDFFSQLQPLMKQLSGQVQRHELNMYTCISCVFKCKAHFVGCLVYQLDQLVVDSAKEKRDMEQKHSTIQQMVKYEQKLIFNSIEKTYFKKLLLYLPLQI